MGPDSLDDDAQNLPDDTNPPAQDNSPSSGNDTIFDTLICKPSTVVISHPPEVQVTARAGTMDFGERVGLHIWIAGRPNPILVEFIDTLLIGRALLNAEQPNLDLDDYGGYAYGVSRRHAQMKREEDALHITDLGSTNGTYLNGFQLQSHQPRILRDGDEITLGQMALRVRFV